MIQLLFMLLLLLLAEVLAVAALLFSTPLTRLLLLGLDRLKGGRGPLVVRAIVATGLVLLGYSVYSMAKIRARSAAEDGCFLTPTDQVLFGQHLLEASLIGYSLFLSLIIDRLHHDQRELHGLRKNVEGAMKQTRALDDAKRELQWLRKNMESVMRQNRVLEEAKSKHLDEINGGEGKIKSLTEQIEQMKMKQLKTTEANAAALRKQTEGLVSEYDRLLKENLNLREQLQTIDRHCSHSDSKKNL